MKSAAVGRGCDALVAKCSCGALAAAGGQTKRRTPREARRGVAATFCDGGVAATLCAELSPNRGHDGGFSLVNHCPGGSSPCQSPSIRFTLPPLAAGAAGFSRSPKL